MDPYGRKSVQSLLLSRLMILIYPAFEPFSAITCQHGAKTHLLTSNKCSLLVRSRVA